jgi:hypothetical protein
MQATPNPTAGGPPTYLKHIVIAGLLGGLLGGVASFAAARFITPAHPEDSRAHSTSTKEFSRATDDPAAREAASEEARKIVETFLSLLKARNTEEFWEHVKQAYTAMTDADYKAGKDRFTNFLIEYDGRFKGSLGEYELISETALSKDLIQYVYLERYTRGGVIWRFVMYRGKDRWFIAFMTWSPDARDAFLP